MHRIVAITAAVALVATPAFAALVPGAKAPPFKTRGANAGKVVPVELASALRQGPVVLYFFPAAFTDGCNAEARAFAAKIDAFRAMKATVIGMSADPVAKLVTFSSSECAGKFTVASAGMALVKAYDVAYPGSIEGRRVTTRTSYVIARDGRIVSVHAGISPVDHVRQTLASVHKLAGHR